VSLGSKIEVEINLAILASRIFMKPVLLVKMSSSMPVVRVMDLFRPMVV
jgi:hypothetical protein